MNGPTRRSRICSGLALGAFAAVALVLPGCATVPTYTQPQAVAGNPQDDASASVEQPPRDADQFSIVQGFVRASANPESDYSEARGYLADSARKRWNPGASVRVVGDTVDTLPSVLQPADRRERVVDLRAQQIGVLRSDGSFEPKAQQIREPVRLRRQLDDQWRVVAPQNGVLIKADEFKRFYQPLRVYFLDPTLGIPVPDQRWVRSERGYERGVQQVMDLLLAGPSDGLQGAVRTAIPASAATGTNVSTGRDGALVINLTQIGEQNRTQKVLIAKQILRSLENVNFRPLRLEAYGEPLLPDHPLLNRGDLETGGPLIAPQGYDSGLVTLENAVHRLDNGLPVPGPAGTGAYRALSAAQSTDRSKLAMVSDFGDGVGLRVGDYGGSAQPLDIRAKTLTRPSWGPRANSQDARSEVWTVGDDGTVYRAVNVPGGPWTVQKVNATAMSRLGRITALRLSRDGVRVAAVINGKLVVGSVRREPDSVSIGGVTTVNAASLSDVVGVDWQEQDVVVVATLNDSTPVERLQVDGLQEDRYDRSNLTPPVTAVTAAPNRPIVVADQTRMWNYPDVSQGWRPLDYRPGPNVVPFYPG